jgi:hypothetical protein
MSVWARAQRLHGLLAKQRKYSNYLEGELRSKQAELEATKAELELTKEELKNTLHNPAELTTYQNVKPYQCLTRNMKWRRRKKIWRYIYTNLKSLPTSQIDAVSINMKWHIECKLRFLV